MIAENEKDDKKRYIEIEKKSVDKKEGTQVDAIS